MVNFDNTLLAIFRDRLSNPFWGYLLASEIFLNWKGLAVFGAHIVGDKPNEFVAFVHGFSPTFVLPLTDLAMTSPIAGLLDILVPIAMALIASTSIPKVHLFILNEIKDTKGKISDYAALEAAKIETSKVQMLEEEISTLQSKKREEAANYKATLAEKEAAARIVEAANKKSIEEETAERRRYEISSKRFEEELEAHRKNETLYQLNQAKAEAYKRDGQSADKLRKKAESLSAAIKIFGEENGEILESLGHVVKQNHNKLIDAYDTYDREIEASRKKLEPFIVARLNHAPADEYKEINEGRRFPRYVPPTITDVSGVMKKD